MKKVFRLNIAIFFMLLVKLSFSQQDPMYTMYMFDKVLINPAYAGSASWMVGTLKYRQQFAGLEGNPNTATVNFHAPIQKKHIGLGLKIINDNIAIINDLNVAGQFAYHLNFAGGKLSLGLEGGFINRRVNYNDLVLNNQADNNLPNTNVSHYIGDAAFGLYYQKKQFYSGFSACRLLKKDYLKKDYSHFSTSKSRYFPHYYLLVGKVFDLSSQLTLEPSMLLKYQSSSPIQADINTMICYQNKVFVGAQYRTGDAVAAILRVNVKEKVRISYSYDFTLSKLSAYSSGAHEILISYGIKLPPPPAEKEVHPRYYY